MCIITWFSEIEWDLIEKKSHFVFHGVLMECWIMNEIGRTWMLHNCTFYMLLICMTAYKQCNHPLFHPHIQSMEPFIICITYIIQQTIIPAHKSCTYHFWWSIDYRITIEVFNTFHPHGDDKHRPWQYDKTGGNQMGWS